MVMLRPPTPALDASAQTGGHGPRSGVELGGAVRFSIRATFRMVSHAPGREDQREGMSEAEMPEFGTHADPVSQGHQPESPPPPKHPTHHVPETDGSNRLNLLLSWGGWQNESWADRLPPLLEPMGVHSLRVRTVREAERAIRTNAVHIAVVDFGLPLDGTLRAAADSPGEEAGPRILELLRRLESPPPTVVVQQPRTARDHSRHMSAALRCDAFAVVDRAAADLELMLKVLQRCMARFYQGRWPGG